MYICVCAQHFPIYYDIYEWLLATGGRLFESLARQRLLVVACEFARSVYVQSSEFIYETTIRKHLR